MSTHQSPHTYENSGMQLKALKALEKASGH